MEETKMLEKPRQRMPLIRPLFVPLILYIGLLVFSISWLTRNPGSPWRYVVALLPMLPGIFIAAGVVRIINQLDELDRKIIFEGIAISFALTFILTTSLGLLGLAGIPQIGGEYIALFMAVAWFIGKLWATRRYQ
jgi:hypothetical protein